MLRAACAELLIDSLCCVLCCVLVGDAMPHSDRQCGCNLRGEKSLRDRERTINFEESQMKKKRRVQKHADTGTWYLVLRIMYLARLYVRNKTQRSMKQHRTARKGTTPHHTARRCADVSYI